jgi:hypothetical protein
MEVGGGFVGGSRFPRNELSTKLYCSQHHMAWAFGLTEPIGSVLLGVTNSVSKNP